MELQRLFLVVCNQRACEILTLDEQTAVHARFQFGTTIREDGSVVIRPDDRSGVTLYLGDIATVRTRSHAFQLSLRSTRLAADATARLLHPDGEDLIGETFVVVENIGLDNHATEVVRVQFGKEEWEFIRYGILFQRRSNALVAKRPDADAVLRVFHRFDESWETPATDPRRIIRITTKKSRADADLYAACPVIPPA